MMTFSSPMAVVSKEYCAKKVHKPKRRVGRPRKTESEDSAIYNYSTSESYALRSANKNYKVLSREEELELILIWKDRSHPRNEWARRKLIRHNQRLVSKSAFYYFEALKASGGDTQVIDIADLIQEGNIGLCRAIDKFKPELGNKLSTVATWWIREAIGRYIKNRRRLLRIPLHILSAIVPVQREWGRAMSDEQVLLSSRELAKRCDISEEEAIQYQIFLKDHLSLDQNAYSDSDTSLGDLFPDRKLTPHIAAEAEEDKSYIQHVISTKLTKEQAEFIRRMFGMKDSEGRTRKQMSAIYNMSEQQVEKMEKTIFAILRNEIDVARLNVQL